MNETVRLLASHRSIRAYTGAAVPDDHVRAAVACGQRASTSSAIEAYCCIRVRDAATREQIVGLTGDQRKVLDAGAFFIVCGDTRRHRAATQGAGKSYDARLEAFLLAVVDATLFAQNMVVAFESMGYGICYIGALRNQLFEVDRLLEIPMGVYPLYGLCVGRPAEEPLERPRFSVEGVLFEERYPDDERLRALMQEHDAQVLEYYERRATAGRPWTKRMAEKFATPRRADLGDYYRSKGADLR